MDSYDQRVYAIGKGPSATTVETPDIAVAKGSTVKIEGRITDISPGTNDYSITSRFPDGVPAVSDASMGDWMKHLYMQFASPTNVEGVPVKIEIIDPNGQYLWIGTAVSDSNGNYAYTFIPQDTGLYMIMATFDGSSAYYGSHSIKYLQVDPAPAQVTIPSYPGYQGPSAQEVANNVVNNLPENPTSSQIAQAVVNAMPEYLEQQAAPDYTNMFIIVFVLVAIAIVIGLVSIFRKK